MTTIIRIMESLVKMNNWTVTRFDLQAYDYGYGIDGYAGYLDVVEVEKRIIIRKDGSFDFI